ncbi:DUF922 domain-containing protein [Winogradskyella litorisediminis]|uniref:DUF922 domain-containing protein n=1 Tax=Winogradskyella litorisediminis TaxID=1156618 RepID=A0ABW3NCR1_9FLAO
MKILTLCLFFSIGCFAQKADDITFSWDENRPLTWEDFQGKPVKNTDAAALTASGISFGFSIGKTGNKITEFTADVECLFYPEESWYKPNEADAHILKHEQLHFNITELHARKFRKHISELQPSRHLQNQLNKIYKAISQASYEMQQQYDEETNHSINKEKQAEWQSFITEQLKRYEAFKTQ